MSRSTRASVSPATETAEELRRRRSASPDTASPDQAVAPEGARGRSSRSVLALQRAIGNQRVGRILRDAPARMGRADLGVQRAIITALTGEPAYSDGLSLATIVSTALDRPPRPVLKPSTTSDPWGGGANAKLRSVMKAIFGDDKSKWDLASPLLLQTGQVHGNQVYENKSGDLPGDATYKEYDTATYKGDPNARGEDRVVIGDKAGTKSYYYTADHYKNFAPFTPA